MNKTPIFCAALIAALSVQPAYAEDAATTDAVRDRSGENGWKLALDSGISTAAGEDDQLSGSLSLSREFESGYAELSLTAVDVGTLPGLLNAIPASSYRATLSAGKSMGNFSIDGYVSAGRRKFETEAVARLGRNVLATSNGKSFGIGASLQYQLELSDRAYLSPFVAVDYDRIDIARSVQLANGDIQALTDREKGTTGSAGLSFDLLFGPESQHKFGLSTSVVATSNSSAARASSPGSITERIALSRDSAGMKSEWAEYGANASFGLTDKLRFRLSVIRTAGFAGSEATSISGGLSIAF